MLLLWIPAVFGYSRINVYYKLDNSLPEDLQCVQANKALEAGITSTKLFSEGKDSPYANIIAVREEDLDNPAVKALVDALLSEETQQWIADKYNGAVIPVITLGN